MVSFDRRVAGISMLKVWISTTVAPFLGAEFVLDISFLDSILMAMVSSTILTTVTLVNILDRYQRSIISMKRGDQNEDWGDLKKDR